MELAWIPGELRATWANPLRTPTEFIEFPLSEVGWASTSPCEWTNWSTSGFGCLWNTVSGVVVGIAGAIYGAVWTAVEAATQFLQQLGAGLAHLAEAAEQAAVSALTAVGHALEVALQALVQFVEKEIVALLQPVVNPLISALTSYWRGVESPLSEAQNDTGQGIPIPQSLGADIGNALSGSVFMGAITIATILAIVVSVIMSIDIGPGEIVTLLMGVIVSVALAASPLGDFISQLESSMTTFGASTVQAVESWFQSYTPASLSGPEAMGPSGMGNVPLVTQSGDTGWTTDIAIFGMLSFLSFGFVTQVKEGFDCAFRGVPTGCSYRLIGIMIALEFVALGLHLAHLANPVQSSLVIAGLIFAGIPLILGFVKLVRSIGKSGFTGMNDLLIILTGIGAVGVGAGVYSLIHR
jgi:hypothetical protein